MGTDKAFLQVGGVTLLERAIATAKQACDCVALVGEKAKFGPYGIVIEDILPSRGPLGGIHAALKSPMAENLNLVLAVDTPAIPGSFLKKLVEIAQDSSATITVPRAHGRNQPLCAIYRREFAIPAEKSLAEGRNKIDPLFIEVATRIVDEQEIESVGFSPDIFDNVNTPEDWQRMQLRLGQNRR
jgi:molybdenum cofactor guanylyltransferase